MSHPYRRSRLLSIALLACSFAASPVLAAEPAGHGHESAGATARLSLDAGRKWATDAPLRKAMSNIRRAVDTAWQAIETGRFSNAGYNALAKTVHGEVAYMVSNCKLEPKADEQLHLVVADMLESVGQMEGRVKDVNRREGAMGLLRALENYGNYFDDPAWKPIRH